MIVRPIAQDELDAFAAYTDDAETNMEFRDYLDRMQAGGTIRPGWCFVAEDAGRFIARIAYWTVPGHDGPLSIDFLQIPSGPGYLETGARLVRESLERVGVPSGSQLDHIIEDPARWQTDRERAVEVLEACGATLLRETVRWEWTANGSPPSESTRLSFRDRTETGEHAFIEAIERVSASGLDRRLTSNRERLGASADAREHFGLLRSLCDEPAWWLLGYTPDGGLAGLVIGGRNAAGPIIAYVGVVPEQRGRGYVDDLLAQGTRTIAGSGARRIRADTDVRNTPMIAAFERAGYRRFATRWEYGLPVAPS